MNVFKLFPIFLFAAATALAQTPATSSADDSKPTPPPVNKSFDVSAMDKTADPCMDFYQYTCGNWVKNNPIPADQVLWARFMMLRERDRYLLWQELDAAAKDPKTPLEKQYGDFYAACMDTAAVEKKGLSPIESSWADIAHVSDAKQLPALLGNLENQGTPDGFFDFGVGQDAKDSSKQIAELYQGGLSLPDRDYYLVDSKRFTTIRAQYIEHVKKMFTLAGDTPEQAAKEAAGVMEIETAMAKASISRTDLRQPENHYHIYTLVDLQKMTPAFDWGIYFHEIGIGNFDTLNVATPDYFKALDTLVQSESHRLLEELSALARAARRRPRTCRRLSSTRTSTFSVRHLQGQKEPLARWKRCTTATDHALGEAVGQDWVKQNFPPAAKSSMDQLVAALEKALGEDIKTLPWMSDRHQDGRRTEADHDSPEDWLPGQVAGLLQRRR